MTQGLGRDIGSAGSMLLQATGVFLRHGPNFILSVIALATAAVLALFVAGRCFLSSMTACVSPEVYYWIGDEAASVQFSVASHGVDLASYVLLTVSLWAVFAVADPGDGHVRYLAKSPRRNVWFLGRAVAYWVVLWIPSAVMDLLWTYAVVPAFDPDSDGLALTYLGFVLLGLVLYSYVHAKIVFILPSVAYQARPVTLRQCWMATRGITGRLFLVFLPIEVVSIAVNLGFSTTGEHIPGMTYLAEHLARFSQVDTAMAAYFVPMQFESLLSAIFFSVMAGAISVCAFRAAFGADQREAQIFQ